MDSSLPFAIHPSTMLFFNALLLTIAGLSSAQYRSWNGDQYRSNNNVYGFQQPRALLYNQGYAHVDPRHAHSNWIGTSGLEYQPFYNNGYNRGAIYGRGYGANRILIDDYNHQGRGIHLLGQRQQFPGAYAVSGGRNFATSGRLLREQEGLPLVANQKHNHVDDESPKPYSFAYDTTDEFNNKMARQEQQDETGRVTGSYSYLDANGIMRHVTYVADEGGFRADVKTNEPGTASSVTGGALIQSDAPSVSDSIAAAAIAPKQINHQAARLQLEKTPVVIRSMGGLNVGGVNPALQHLSLKDQKLALGGYDGNILSLAQAKGFEVNPNFMRFALPSINQSFGPANLVKIADPSIGTQFLKAKAAAAA